MLYLQARDNTRRQEAITPAMSQHYTTSDAARLAGIAASSTRNYTRDPRLAPHFTPQATPPPGKARQLAADDVKLLRYVGERTRLGISLDDVAMEIQRGELDRYPWTPPAAHQGPTAATGNAPDSPPTTSEPSPTAALVAVSRSLAELFTGELTAARDESRELREQLTEAREHIAALETELRLLRERRSLLARILGRG